MTKGQGERPQVERDLEIYIPEAAFEILHLVPVIFPPRSINERTTTPPSRTTSEQFSASNGIWNMIPQIAIKNPNPESNGTPCYGLVHLLVHLGSAKNPMFIGLGTGGTPVHPPPGIAHA